VKKGPFEQENSRAVKAVIFFWTSRVFFGSIPADNSQRENTKIMLKRLTICLMAKTKTKKERLNLIVP